MSKSEVRKIYLMRHSYAESGGGKADKDRELTHAGLAAVRSLGKILSGPGFDPDLILCSSAVRTSQTAVNLVEELDMNEKIISYRDVLYNASVREMLHCVNDLPEKVYEVLIIGHNPTITYFSEFLSAAPVNNMEPCSLVTIETENASWDIVSQGTGIFKTYQHPSQ